MKKVLVIIVFVIGISFSLKAQMDTEFWFAAPDITKTTSNTIPLVLDSPIVLRIATYMQPASVEITQPAGGGLTPITVSIPANTTQTVDISNWLDQIENKPPGTVNNKGIYIKSTTSVTVYYEVVSDGGTYNPGHSYNPEIFTLKGRNALGNFFTIPGQTILQNDASGHVAPYYASFEIVATEDTTTVTITPAHNIVGNSAMNSFTVTLNRGQSYSAQATGTAAGVHLNGSTILSDKPIAITVSDDVLLGSPPYFGACADLTGDQIVPDRLLGTEYIAINGSLNGPNTYLFITATENNTTVYKDGVVQGLVNAGQNINFPVGGQATYVTADKPITVWQLNGIGCEFGATQLPKIYCTGSSNVSYVRSTNGDIWINIFIRDGHQGDFTVNGSNTVINATQFSAVPATSGQWVYARIQLPSGSYPKNTLINIQNSTSVFHVGILDGAGIGSGASYGYFSDYGNNPAYAIVNPNPACEGDTLKLNTGNYIGATYTWAGPNNFSSQLPNPIISNANSSHIGWYFIDVLASDCSGRDSVYVNIYDLPDLQILTNDTTLCDNESLQLNASGAANYTWTPNTFLSNTNISNPITTPTSDITYYLKGSIHPQCEQIDSIIISVISPDAPFLGADTFLCEGDSIILHTNTTYSESYIWSNNDTTASITVYQSGEYWVKTKVEHCDGGTDTVNVTFYPYPDLQILTDDTTICEHSSIELKATGATTYRWYPNYYLSSANVANPIAKPEESITYYVTGSIHDQCQSTDSISIKVLSVEAPHLLNDTSLCDGDSLVLFAGGNASGYLWSTDDTTASITVYQSGKYWVITMEEMCHGGIDTTDIVFLPYPDLKILYNDTVICENSSIQLHATGAVHYEWSPSDFLSNSSIANPVASPVENTTYYLTASIYSQCVLTDSIHIVVSPFPDVKAYAEHDTIKCFEQSIQLYATGAASYTWYPEALFEDNTKVNPIASLTKSTTFQVIGKNEYGCASVDSVTVTLLSGSVFFVPNAFSPNRDGYNDFFKPIILCDFKLKNFSVYNRYGELVFFSEQKEPGWDGSYKGGPMDIGTYFWYLEGVDDSGLKVYKKGDVTLVR